MDMIATRTTIGRGIFDDMVEAVEGGEDDINTVREKRQKNRGEDRGGKGREAESGDAGTM